MNKKDIYKILKDPRIQWGLTILILIIALVWSSSVRLSNWDLLTDQTTGEKIPLALDPYYFLRIAETIAETNGNLPEFDTMRASPNPVPWHFEIMPQTIVGIWKVSNLFGEYSLREINVFSPVFFFMIGLVLFFFMVYALTNSKLASIISSVLLAFSPSFLYRTMAGFSDHESIGMAAVFACLLFFAYSFKFYNKNKIASTLFGLGLGFLTMLVLATWGGAVSLVLVIIPVSFFFLWLLKSPKKSETFIFYISWAVSSLLFSKILGDLLFKNMANKFTSTYGLAIPGVLGFMLIDTLVKKFLKKKGIKEDKMLYISLGSLAVLGSIALTILGKNIFGILAGVWENVLFPFGRGRIGLTVAENAQPYLTDWINQSGTLIFWMFVFGTFIIGIELAKALSSKKEKIIASLLWMAMISAMIFSRVNSSALFNGENFISQAVYILGVGAFAIYFFYLVAKKRFDPKKISTNTIILITLMFFIVLNGRSAVRTFFLIAPFVVLAVGIFFKKMLDYAISSKEEVARYALWSLLIFALIGASFSLGDYIQGSSAQARQTGPSANIQWQGAMSWVRDNTESNAIFSHWWDYGYWVQTLGKRATIADGGHFENSFDGDHKIGRYVLTTPFPETALSFFKTMNIDYLLIDPTDLGKYAAYSSIGSDDSGNDRYSAVPVMRMDPTQTIETSNETIVVYQGGVFLDEDITYNLNGKNIFLPQRKSAVAGVILRINNQNNSVNINQPTGVFFYNNQRYDIPIRYVYIQGSLIDTGTGLESVVKIIPALEDAGMQQIGAAIYLSPKVSKGLFAQLYLLENAFGGYDTIELVHKEEDFVVSSLKSQGAPVEDFVYYRGFRGPIKIWNTENIPKEINIIEEFKEPFNGTYGALDNLNFKEGSTQNEIEKNSSFSSLDKI